MPKLVITYENERIKKELTFRNEVFSYTMQPWDEGSRTADNKGFEYQLEDKYSDDDDINEIVEAVDCLDFGSDEDIEEALERLTEYE